MQSIKHTFNRTYILLIGSLLAVLITALALTTPTHAAPMSAADQKAVDAIVAKVMKEYKQPGLSISLTGPRGDYAKSYGIANNATRTPMNINNHFRMGSVTKTFVSTAILIQVDKGKIKLTDKLGKYVS